MDHGSPSKINHCYCPQRCLQKGNVFTSMCHSFCPQGGLPKEGSASGLGSACIQGGLPMGVSLGSLHPGGSTCGGLGRPPLDTMGYDQQAGGTHPTSF